jgi:integrase
MWDRVDLQRRDIFIPKSKNGNARHIPLNDEALAAFKLLRARSVGQERVFISKREEPLGGYKHWFDGAVEKAGIKDFTWHCFRHTFASRLVMARVDIRTVAELMGHKTIQMTMRYAHLAPQHKLEAVQQLVGRPCQIVPTDTKTNTSGFRALGGKATKASEVVVIA